MNKNIIETFDLSKEFNIKGGGTIKALNNVNISIKEGEIFGLLGPNGAGKTTLISILTTLIQPTSGYALINGFNIIKKPLQAKANIGLMLESEMLYTRITAYKNLKFFCKIYKIKDYEEKIKDMTKKFGIYDWLYQYVENFSSGMKMKLALCRTLLLERKILFLDEPTIGLDIKSKLFFIDVIKNLDRTIFITSHDLAIIEGLCDKIAFIDKGKIIKFLDKEELDKLKVNEVNIEIEISKDKNNLKNELIKLDFVKNIEDNLKKLIITIKNKSNYRDLFSVLKNYDINKIKEKDIDLQDLFLKIF